MGLTYGILNLPTGNWRKRPGPVPAPDGCWPRFLSFHHCARLNPGTVPPPPIVDWDVGDCRGDDCTATIIIDTWAEEAEVEITRQGLDGEDTTTGYTDDGSFEFDMELGEWIEVGVAAANENGPGQQVPTVVHVTNDFLNTDRNLRQLGGAHALTWVAGMDGPYVEIDLTGMCDPFFCDPAPLVAVYRRAEDSNWIQVTGFVDVTQPQQAIHTPWIVNDESDLTTHETYEYVIVAFSPTTYEMIGYWNSTVLQPLDPVPDPIEFAGRLDPAEEWPASCAKTMHTPTDLGLPETIHLHNGWELMDLQYWLYDRPRPPDPACPTHEADNQHLSGTGQLSNGRETWRLDFFDIAVDGGASLKQGRVVARLNKEFPANSRFASRYLNIEFLPNDSTAEVLITLPDHMTVDSTEVGRRSNRIFVQLTNLDTLLRGDPFTRTGSVASPALTIVDENLPWLVHMTSVEIGHDTIRLAVPGGGAFTFGRLGYSSPAVAHPAVPDNNGGYLRKRYDSGDALISPTGLQGEFATDVPLAYSTSTPAAVVIYADSARLEIADSSIAGGELSGASARLDYYYRGALNDRIVRDSTSCGPPRHFAVCGEVIGKDEPATHWHALDITPDAGQLPIGEGGQILSNIELSSKVKWVDPRSLEENDLIPQDLDEFEVQDTLGTLYIPAAVFGGMVSSWAPRPPENAWHKIDDPVTGGDFDPGVNLNYVPVPITFSKFTPPDFDANVDLYVRRGGVSQHLEIEDGGDEIRINDHNFQDVIKRLEYLFRDNARMDDLEMDCQIDRYLPYPSDAWFPLQLGTGCDPNQGEMRELLPVQHEYWRFEQTPDQWWTFFTEEKYGDYMDTTAQAALFQVRGMAKINGLNRQSTTDIGEEVNRQIMSEWFPNGDIGDVQVANPGLPAAGYRVSGFHFSLSDILLSRYYSEFLDENSLPDTMGLDLEDNLVEMPDVMLSGGEVTPESLKSCAQQVEAGCGFVVLDGEVAVDHFEVLPEEPVHHASGSQTIPPWTLPASPFPVAVNRVGLAVLTLVLRGPQVSWIWPVLNDALELPIPVKFLGNTDGGALGAVVTNAPIFPAIAGMPNVLQTDLGLVIEVDWDDTDGYLDTFGLAFGYAASQAVFRSLAMQRPDPSGGVLDYDTWDLVQEDVREWAGKFGYQLHDGLRNDPVDLAEEIWDEWCSEWESANECLEDKRLGFDATYGILEPRMIALHGVDAYGVTGIEAGHVLQQANLVLHTGLGEISVQPLGLDNVRIKKLQFGIQAEIPAESRWRGELLEADWVSAEWRDNGEIRILGENVHADLLGEFGPTADFELLVYTETDWERIEGGVQFHTLEIPDLFALDLSVVFGSGQYGPGNAIEFFGGHAEVNIPIDLAPDADFSLSLVFGTLPLDSEILRNWGFGDVLDKFEQQGPGAAQTFEGFYVYAAAEWPLMEGDCMLEAVAGGSLALWYFVPQGSSEALWGGTLTGHVWATVGCILSARGQLALTFEQILDGYTTSAPPGETSRWGLWNRTCNSPRCGAFTGTFWVAIGVGWCSPSTWDSWSARWWGDSWCYTIGAIVGLSYLDPAPEDEWWDFDWDADYE